MRQDIIRYDVVQTGRWKHAVFEISADDTDPKIEYHDRVREFWSLETAIACANGLAGGTWTHSGPIRAQFKVGVADEPTQVIQ